MLINGITSWDHKVYVNYLLCFGNSNSIMKVISYRGQLSLMFGNGNVKVLHDLKFYLIRYSYYVCL